MTDQNEKMTDFVCLQLEKYYKFKNQKNYNLDDWNFKGLVVLMRDLETLWNNIVLIFGNDSEKVFNLFDDFPGKYVKQFSINWLWFFERRQEAVKEDIEKLTESQSLKYRFITWLLDYLKYKEDTPF